VKISNKRIEKVEREKRRKSIICTPKGKKRHKQSQSIKRRNGKFDSERVGNNSEVEAAKKKLGEKTCLLNNKRDKRMVMLMSNKSKLRNCGRKIHVTNYPTREEREV
jgi:hypothetical protein